MLNSPDTEHSVPPSGKLVLPAPPDEVLRASGGQPRVQISPGQLIRQKTTPAPAGMLPKLAYYWRKDPAYKVFMIAMVMVVLASVVFVTLAGSTFFGKSLFSNSFPQNPPTVVAPGGTVDLRPKFPTPGGANGSGQSSQPPAQSTPSLKSTPTNSPSPTAQPSPTTSPGPGGGLTVQITSYQPFVVNGNQESVTVLTNSPGATVELFVRYNVSPYRDLVGPQATDANGYATLSWLVSVSGFGHRFAQATVTAVATDQNGQRAFSSPVSIQIIG
jgi:hypothetical protein